MVDRAREDELAKTARFRGAAPEGSEDSIAMREAEAEHSGATPELVGEVVSRSVLNQLEIQGAIPAQAPDDVRQKMVARMARWRAEVDRFVEGENSLDRAGRLKRFGDELWQETTRSGCGCGGTGLVERTGKYQARSGRETESTYMAICDCRFGDERRVHARGEIYGMDGGNDDPF